MRREEGKEKNIKNIDSRVSRAIYLIVYKVFSCRKVVKENGTTNYDYNDPRIIIIAIYHSIVTTKNERLRAKHLRLVSNQQAKKKSWLSIFKCGSIRQSSG